MNIDPAGDVVSLREHIGAAAELIAQLEIDADRLVGDPRLTALFAHARRTLIAAGDEVNQ